MSDVVAKPQNAELPDMTDTSPSVWSKARRFLPLAVVAAGLAIGYANGVQNYFSLEFLAESRDRLKAIVDASPFLSVLGFIGIYATAVALSFPAASVLTVFGGFLFGWMIGGIAVAFGATIGATLIFLAARTAFGDFLRDRIGGRVKSLADGFEKDAFGYLLVLRLAPVFPFFVMNVAPALFRVPLKTYVAATFIGILPGTFAYAWLGEGVDSIIEAAAASGGTPSIGDLVTPQIIAAFAALAVAALIPTLIRKWRAR